MVVDNTFDKEKSLIVKGFAILCMITYHVWGVNKYEPMLGENLNIERYIGQFGHICVPIYLFLSGYAIYLISCRNNFKYKDLVKRVFNLLSKFWFIFILFIPAGFLIFNVYKFDIKELIMNFTTLKITYNGDWWFIRLYIQLLILFPIFKFVISKYSFMKTLMISFGVYVIGFFMFLVLKLNLSNIVNFQIYQDIQVMFVDQLIFTIGCLFAKYNAFKLIKDKLKEIKLDKLYIYVILLLLIFLLRSIIYVFFEDIIKFGSPDWFDFSIVPIIIVCVYNMFSKGIAKNLMIILGNNSDNMWLTHTFFYELYFQKEIYSLCSSILILFTVIVFSFVSSNIINLLYNFFRNVINENKKNRIIRYQRN